MNLIEANRLNKSFGPNHAVRDLNLNVKEGEIYGLVGSDGAGKTTTLRLLVGALKADSGKVFICGHDIKEQGEEARAQVGYLSQRFSLYDDLSVLENIRFFAELRGLRQDEWLPRSMEILDFVGLDRFINHPAGKLSGGMKQKLGLASALVTRPRVLLLDEPTTGVDPVTRQDFWQLIIHIATVKAGEEGARVSVLLTTPYMDEASRCHRVGFMREGRIITEGAPSELKSGLNGRILEVRGKSLTAIRELAVKTDGVEDVRQFGDKIHLRVQPGKAETVIAILGETLPTREGFSTGARLVPPTLEDVFISLSESISKGNDPGYQR